MNMSSLLTNLKQKEQSKEEVYIHPHKRLIPNDNK
jgi:hypothetical protein